LVERFIECKHVWHVFYIADIPLTDISIKSCLFIKKLTHTGNATGWITKQ
jgi:hypothetical protein